MAFDPQIRLELLKTEITLGDALEDEENMLQRLDYPQKQVDFCAHLMDNFDTFPAIVAHHLNIDSSLCEISAVEYWRRGSFNWCIPMLVNSSDYPTVMLRFPLPYKVGESEYPGNADEKLRCEAATYVYIQENCPDVPIPKLWGFGFSNGLAFTTLETASFFRRSIRYLHNRIRSILRYPMLSPFLKNEFHTGLRVGYLLMDYIQDGEMLSETFKDRKGDEDLQSNLFTDLSRILLSLAKIPQPRIGSFTFEDDGRITLSNRPLTLQLHMLENEKVPTNIGRKTTYSSVADYIYDLLGYHDSRLLHQPNSMDNEDDGRRQMGAISLMRATSVHFINLETRHGPFYFTLTDLHQSNIFVDQDWHVKSIIDLEWACSLPSEMLQPPYWITDEPIDHLTGENLEKFSKVRDKFMSIFEREEKLYTHTNQAPRTRMMQKNWETGSFWYFAALESTKGLYNIFRRNIRPKFSENFSYQEVSHYWRTNTDKVIQAKLDDRQSYRDNLIQRAMKGRELSEGESAERKKALREREL